MDMDALLDELQVGMNRRLSALPERIRPFTTSFTNLPRAISLTGPRGVGKTVFLLHHAVGKKILYISADSPLLAGVKLYSIIKQVFLAGYRVIRYEQDKKAKTVGAKLFLADPALYMALAANTGTAREAMVAMFCTNSGWKVYASKDETKGDFIISRLHNGKVTRFLLEVGGSKKHKKSADFVIRDDIDLPGLTALPLWLLGMGW